MGVVGVPVFKSPSKASIEIWARDDGDKGRPVSHQ